MINRYAGTTTTTDRSIMKNPFILVCGCGFRLVDGGHRMPKHERADQPEKDRRERERCDIIHAQ